jgi:hypothetical protein
MLWTTIMTHIKPQIVELINYFVSTIDYLFKFLNFIKLVKYTSLTALHKIEIGKQVIAPYLVNIAMHTH